MLNIKLLIMKKIGLLFLMSCVFLTCNNVHNKKDVSVIGVILPLTGDAAVYGQGIKKGIDFAYNSLSEEDTTEVRKTVESKWQG